MATNILFFILFSLLSVLLFYISPVKIRKYILLIENILFYWIVAGLSSFFLLILLILYSYYIAEFVKDKSKITFFLTMLPILGNLIICKYSFFFTERIIKGLSLLGLESGIHSLRIIFPIGISFYTLKMLSYVIDRHYDKTEKTQLLDYCIYILNFTQIISGPIQRPAEFLSQISSDKKWNPELFSNGLYKILLGLFKKLVIANRCTKYVDTIFANSGTYPAFALYLALFLYTIELYADFSGYSDISIGLSLLLGLKTEENFKQPYFSSNIKEFWNRWHISLSSWLKDYVYIRLGGNRCSKFKHIINIMITFAISGVWHGKGWNFMLWGILHGFYNLITPSKKFIEKINSKKISRIISTGITFCCVSIAWIFFRTENIKSALIYFKHMVTDFSVSYSSVSLSLLPFTNDNTCIIFVLQLFIFIFLLLLYDLLEYKKSALFTKKYFCICWQTILIVSVILFGTMNNSGFIYAQF